jgi:hypothetical protein
MQLSVKFKSKFSGPLCAMQHSAESRHVRQFLCKIETKFEGGGGGSGMGIKKFTLL